ncbi:GATA transcription factor 7-like [Bidens hawaiensis]|uniref:GATA transcription factor 7-like n=1 Tax=Bidens hawaiensis TaxID=980011 RepID=UPI00404AB742
MACIEIEARALKSNFLKEIRMNSTQQSFFDDLWCLDNVSSDEFSVDDLLDLSDKDFSNSDGDRYSHEDEEKNSIISTNFSTTASLPDTEIHFPVDEMESLEWLSQIVDDSTLELSLSLPPVSLKKTTGKLPVRPVIPSFTVLGLSYPVPRKSRSKRSKKTGRVWSSLTESSTDDSSSYDSSTTMLSANPVLLFDCFMTFLKPATKKFKKNPVHKNNSFESIGRCTHCHVQKTPQWRTGPLGPKTLCNACGVRFKSGRLFPEYRPACSPTFSGGLHSNSHRKVLEMRKQKEPVKIKPGFGSGLGSLSC